jgi:hypothetical protein
VVFVVHALIHCALCNRKLWCSSLWCCGAGGADNDLGAGADDETGDGVKVQVITLVFIVV